VGSKGQRRKSLRQFYGFDESITLLSVETKLSENRKKWNINLLKEACDIFGLDKTGSRIDLCKRIAEYCFCPYETRSVDEVPSKIVKTNSQKASNKKRKAGEEGDQPKKKRAPSAFMLFSQAMRPQVKVDNADATFGGLGKIIGAMWNGLPEDDKNVSAAHKHACTVLFVTTYGADVYIIYIICSGLMCVFLCVACIC
jgi:hypothetical protein